MPRAPTQKSNHASANAGHPYSITPYTGPSTSAPTSSASVAHSPHAQQQQQQQHLQNSPPHMHSLPPQSSNYPAHQQQVENAGSSSKQTSPRDSPHLQAQPLTRPQKKQKAGQGELVSTMKAEAPSSTETARAPMNGSASPTAPAPPSASSTSSASGSASTAPAMATSGSTVQKKKHVCSTCDRAFTTSGHLARHARVHTGERNHKCPFPGCETRCSRQDNLQQHYRIHLSPGSRRSSSSATRAAIQRAISNPNATSPVAVSAGATASAMDLDAPPPLAQASLPPPSLAQAHVPYQPNHQPYPCPPQASPLSQSHVPSPHLPQQPYPQTPPIGNGNGHIYENGNSGGLAVEVSQSYGNSQPESPADHSTPASASASADASPVIGGPGSIPPGSQPYPVAPQPYLYVSHPGYYQPPQHAPPGLQGPGANTAVYAPPPPPSSSSNGQYPPTPQISTFYQQHHYPPQAYMSSAPPPAAAPPQTQTPPSYPAHASHTIPQQIHEQQQQYVEQPKAKAKRRPRSSGGSMTHSEMSPNESPVIASVQGHTNGRTNGQGQSNVYAYYGMSAPSSSASAPPPPSSNSISSAAPPSSASSNGPGRYAINGNGSGYGQFQLHTPPPPPPPLTSSSSSSGITTSSNISYASSHTTYSSQSMDGNGTANANGTHSPPPVLAPIQTKRSSYQASLPSRYSYGQHPNHTNNGYPSNAAYASVGKGYTE